MAEGMRHGMDIFDRPIRHQQSMLRGKILPILRRALDGLFHEGHVLRMNPPERKFHGRLRRSVVLEDSKCFLRPEDLAGRNLPAEAPRTAEPLSFGQVRLAAPELLRQMLLLSHIHCGANETLEDPRIETRHTNPPYMSKLAVWSHDALLDIAT